jgi:hypothetical protein
MFKPGDVAKVRADGRIVTILADAVKGGKWPIATSEGTFEEAELSQGHPSVIATANGDSQSDIFLDLHSASEDTFDEKVSYQMLRKLEKGLTKATLDLNGHWKNGASFEEGFQPLTSIFLDDLFMSPTDAAELLRATATGKALDRWLPINLRMSLSALRTCPFCGEEDFGTETNGTTVRLDGPPCKFSDGLPPTEWELNVPSGKLVIANDLRALFPLQNDQFDVNTYLGCRQTTLAYAAVGLAHGFVGNTCPGVYRCSGDTFKVANPPQKEEWDGKKYVAIDPPRSFEGTRVAGICTDLWWYSIADHNEVKRRCKRFQRKITDFNVETIDVKPGVYRFSHDEGTRLHEGPDERIYTRFEWVREPDPVGDLLSSYDVADVHAHAYVQAKVADWPTLYGKTKTQKSGRRIAVPWTDLTEEERSRAWQRIADQIFFTLGAGVAWHEKGFPRDKVPGNIPDIEPPAFRAQHAWYPFSRPYGGIFEAKKLTPSFAKLAFRILESVISFGMDVRESGGAREVRYVRERMLVAVQRYRELAAQHPEQADPDYVAWLGQKDRAEAWVKAFPLGPESAKKKRLPDLLARKAGQTTKKKTSAKRSVR